jgi:transketolase
MKIPITVVGSSNTDILIQTDCLPTKGETVLGGEYIRVKGGKGANQAVAVARAGMGVNFIAKIGKDQFGDESLASLKAENVEIKHCFRDDTPSGLALIVVDKRGDNQIVVAPGSNIKLSLEDIEKVREIIENSQILLLQLETPLETVKKALQIAKRAGVTTILNPAPAQRLTNDLLRMADILVPNETEASILTGKAVRHIETASKAGKDLLNLGAGKVIITMGEGGAMLIIDEDAKHFPAYKVDAVDTTVAGDAFIGGLAVALAQGKSISEAIEHGNVLGALSVTKFGAQPSLPTKDQIDDFIKTHGDKTTVQRESERGLDLVIKSLNRKAKIIRKNILKMLTVAGSGHPGGSLSAVEILTSLYFHVMIYNPKDPAWEDRDRFILSKGHAAPVLYSTLAEAGFFPESELATLRKIKSRLQGHPDMKKTPGVDMSTGSLGQGLSAANGMAISAKLKNKDYRVYVVLGDGELEEGQIWEAAMSAVHYRLDNLCVILDYNGLQIDGAIDKVKSTLEPLLEKWQSFGWSVLEIDGHDIGEILSAFEQAKLTKEKPTIIIAHTIKGKGVSFMERVVGYHGSVLSKPQLQEALKELE